MKYLAYAAIFIAAYSVSARKMHNGPKIVTDSSKTCQYAVARDWTQDSVRTGVSSSPDNEVTVVVQEAGHGQLFEDVKKNARLKMSPLKIIQDTDKRYWYVYRELADGDDSPDTHWYVAVLGNGHVCTAQITFKSAIGDSLIRRIVQTIKPVK